MVNGGCPPNGPLSDLILSDWQIPLHELQMKSLFSKLFIAAAGLALGATAAMAAPWPPAKGDLILGVQAVNGTGSSTNVFFNLGPATTLRDAPNPSTAFGNIKAELTAAFGADWATRTDLYFGITANRSNAPASGLGSVPPVSGDPSRTIYATKGTASPNATLPWNFTTSSLGVAATAQVGFIEAIDDVPGNQVATLSQGAFPVQWNNSWTEWNPVPGAGFAIFTGGIQRQFAAVEGTSRLKMLDLFRIPGDTGDGVYVTSILLSDEGLVTAGNSFVTLTVTPPTNGTVTGAGLFPTNFTAQLTATPSVGYGFVNWSGADTSSVNPLSVVMNANKTIAANFALLPAVVNPTFTSVTGTGATLGGEVTSVGGAAFTERGVVYADAAVNADPIVAGTSVTKLTTGTGTGTFTAPTSAPLTVATTYAFKAFVTTAAGTVYTNVAFFTTDTTVSLPGGIGTVSNRVIRSGDSQLFRFTLADAQAALFTGTGASGLIAWELRDSSNLLVDSGTGNVNVDEALLAGDYSLRLTKGGGVDETVSLNLDASGNVVVNPQVTVAPASIISRKARPVAGSATVRNNSPLADTFRVSASAGNGFFGAAYFDGTGNITAALVAGTYVTPSLDENSAAVALRATITPNKKKIIKKGKKGSKPKTLKKSFTTTIRATSVTFPAVNAAGSITVRTQ